MGLPRRVTGDDGRNPPNGLLASFRALVSQLDLGPEPQLRECPVCSKPCAVTADCAAIDSASVWQTACVAAATCVPPVVR